MSSPTSVEQSAAWPATPYKGLSYYGPTDRPLYAGRDADIRMCSALLMLPETRTLILHGKTGCGKSSFLRAGLIPTVESEGFGFEFLKHGPKDNLKVVFIRCTSAPLKQLADQVFELANSVQETRSPVGRATIDLRGALNGVDRIEDFRDRAREEGCLARALMEISSLLPKTLIFVLDQAEEVLTLNPSDNQADSQPGDRAEFFSFLQDFNSMSLDVKLVIALRTEYYGRFFNAMNVDRRVRSDAKEYLLDDFNEAMLLGAIERPASKSEVRPWGVPFLVYRFRYDEGLPLKITQDLLKAKQTGGVLPVMQIVCKSLYDGIAAGGAERVVTFRQYEALGGVEGIIDEHIRRSLHEAFRLGKLPQKRAGQEEEHWRMTLCKLTAVQEDGTVTTNVIPSNLLKEEAREQRTMLPPDGVLEYLASPEVLLVRKLSLVDARDGKPVESFSLGHDVIGLALNQWRTTNEEQRKHKHQIRRIQIYSAVAASLAILAFLLYFQEQRSLKAAVVRDNAERIVRQSRTQGPADYKLGLLLAVAASRMLSDADIQSSDALRDTLIQGLVSSPDYVVGLPAININQSIRTEVSGQTLIVYPLGRFGDSSNAASLVVLDSDHASVTPLAEPVLPSKPFFVRRYWSRDGRSPLLSTDGRFQDTGTGNTRTLSFTDVLRMISPKPQGAKGVLVFGWESLALYKCGDPGCTLWPLAEPASKPGSLSIQRPIVAVQAGVVFGGRSSLFYESAGSGTGNDGAILLRDFQHEEAMTIFGAADKVSLSPISLERGPRDKEATIILRDSVSFAPNDGAVAFATKTAEGKMFVDFVIPNWSVRHVAIDKHALAAGELAGKLAVGRSANKTLIAANTAEGSIRVYTYPGKDSPSAVLNGSKGLQSLSFTEQAKRLFAVAPDGSLLVWNMDLDRKKAQIQGMSLSQEIRMACRLAGRSLTKAELLNYVGSEDMGPVCGK